MNEPEWLDKGIVLHCYCEHLVRFGGYKGMRDEGALESALARPINKLAYGGPDLALLAAAYGFGIARSHPFIDGNKPTALAAIIMFLGLNGRDLDAPVEEVGSIIDGVAAGEVSEIALADWIRKHLKPLDAPAFVP
jgi:death on curing protein